MRFPFASFINKNILKLIIIFGYWLSQSIFINVVGKDIIYQAGQQRGVVFFVWTLTTLTSCIIFSIKSQQRLILKIFVPIIVPILAWLIASIPATIDAILLAFAGKADFSFFLIIFYVIVNFLILKFADIDKIANL